VYAHARVHTHTRTHTHTFMYVMIITRVTRFLLLSCETWKTRARSGFSILPLLLSFWYNNVTGLCKYNTITTRICSTPRTSDLVCTKVYHYPQLSLSTLTWFTRIGNLRDDCRYTSEEERWKKKTLLAREYEKLAIKDIQPIMYDLYLNSDNVLSNMLKKYNIYI